MRCPDCGSNKVVWSSDEGLMCNKCGVILGENYHSGRQVV